MASAKNSWVRWRGAKSQAPSADTSVALFEMPAGDFCATCWAAGKFLVQARNGEGLIPVACTSCSGTGRTT